jgi:outer membrane lipoprotein SlyB
MTKAKVVFAVVAAGVAAAACGSDPYSYSEPRYVQSGSYYSNRDVALSESGRVVAIDVVRGGGHTSGAGAVVGGIVGGVVGHQFGSGRGNDVATAAGAVGGAVAGNEVERRRNDDEAYRVVVEFRDGRQATFMQNSLDGIRVGDRVRVDGNRLYRD